MITDISSVTLFTDKFGNALCREMNISLREFVGDIEENPLGAALNIGGNSLLGSILPAGAVKALSQVKETVQKGAELFNQGRQIVDSVRDAVAVVRQLSNDPAAALAYLPGILKNLDGAIGNFGELTGMRDLLEGVHNVLPAASELAREGAGIYEDLMSMKDSLTLGEKSGGTDWDNWFKPADSALDDINERIYNAAAPVAEMTAWVVLRKDEDVIDDTTDRT